ncbi:DNA repair protein RecO [Synechococcus sp. PCC 7336]|uniref:DNA repair protein RecO n=1 Tax=Synechococcus sp. PCC 7336 TaxID=195250 RepID=UPI0003474C3F|nr:DNA repair protein RecO [Synechococcus sp. PCC 7336]
MLELWRSPMERSKTYRATGINLKAIPLGESDRIVTILTQEHGLVRAVAKGARKQKSSLGGRVELFVVNDLVIARGRSLDRISQAHMTQSFPRMRSSLAQLTVAQYWAEVVLHQALAQQPQEDLFVLLVEHLQRLEQSPAKADALPLLVHGLYHLLAIAGIAPQVRPCADCRSSSDWSFSPDAGGVACSQCIDRQRPMQRTMLSAPIRTVLKLLPKPKLPELPDPDVRAWLMVERLLRKAIQYHFDRAIQSASLVESCFRPAPTSLKAAESSSPYPASS